MICKEGVRMGCVRGLGSGGWSVRVMLSDAMGFCSVGGAARLVVSLAA